MGNIERTHGDHRWTTRVCPQHIGAVMGPWCAVCGHWGEKVEVVRADTYQGAVEAAASTRAAWQAFTELRAEEADVDVAFDALDAALGGQ